jgi:PIN domain nuclease of toxin-antitoxin system
MRILLDTNIVIPLFQARAAQLDVAVRDAILASEVPAQVSVASLWEIAIKNRVGKLSLGVALTALPSLVRNWGFSILAISHEHALVGLHVETSTRDPFDRMLLAQCQVEGLRLITTDQTLNAHPLAWRPA